MINAIFPLLKMNIGPNKNIKKIPRISIENLRKPNG